MSNLLSDHTDLVDWGQVNKIFRFCFCLSVKFSLFSSSLFLLFLLPGSGPIFLVSLLLQRRLQFLQLQLHGNFESPPEQNSSASGLWSRYPAWAAASHFTPFLFTEWNPRIIFCRLRPRLFCRTQQTSPGSGRGRRASDYKGSRNKERCVVIVVFTKSFSNPPKNLQR